MDGNHGMLIKKKKIKAFAWSWRRYWFTIVKPMGLFIYVLCSYVLCYLFWWPSIKYWMKHIFCFVFFFFFFSIADASIINVEYGCKLIHIVSFVSIRFKINVSNWKIVFFFLLLYFARIICECSRASGRLSVCAARVQTFRSLICAFEWITIKDVIKWAACASVCVANIYIISLAIFNLAICLDTFCLTIRFFFLLCCRFFRSFGSSGLCLNMEFVVFFFVSFFLL